MPASVFNMESAGSRPYCGSGASRNRGATLPRPRRVINRTDEARANGGGDLLVLLLFGVRAIGPSCFIVVIAYDGNLAELCAAA